MQKQALAGRSSWLQSLQKTLLIMKLAVIIILISTLQVSAEPVFGQTISVNLKNTEVKKVLKTIERDGYYRFAYNTALSGLKQKKDISVTGAGIEETMNTLLAGTNLTYKLAANNLVVVLSTNAAEYNAQVVTGRVTDENGQAVSNVSVTERGTSNGTSTDNNGNYSLNVGDNATLVFSSVGYETQTVAVGGRNVVDVRLLGAVKKIDEVVVIGYGTASKRDLTGSIAKVSGKEVADKPNTNPVSSLQSKVAGLYVVNNGTPGREPDIRIRGTQSIGQVKPLYVVDGIFQDNIDYINPNDIESMEVLKDPSSLAIFGIRGGTGVIAITTKKAKAGQTIINYNTTFGFKNLVDKIKMASASEFDTLFAEENRNNGVPTPNYDAVKNSGNNTDWIDAVTRKAKFQSHNISLSGTGDKNRFNVGLGYVSDEGIIRHERLKKYLISFGDEFKVNKAIKLGVTLNVNRQENPYDAGWVLDAARKVMPHISAQPKNFRVRNPYGSVYDTINIPIYSGLVTALQNSGVNNPLVELENEWDKTISRENRYVGSAFADISFLKNFNFRSTWYADISDINSRVYKPIYYAYNPMDNTPYVYTATNLAQATTSVSETNNSYRKFQQDYILTYRKKFGEHSLTGTAGLTYYAFSNRFNSATSTAGGSVSSLQIPNNPDLWYVSNGFGKVQEGDASGGGSDFATSSILGRLLYSYKGKYYLNASVRDDGSSRIPEKNRHQMFWALGAAWEISKETFMQNISQINYLKLKASTGVLGNQSTYGPVSNYPFYPGIDNPGNNFGNFGTLGYLAASPAYVKNPNLKWETIDSYEFGLEANAFNNRLHFEYSYYNKLTKDMMTYIDLSSLGYDDIIQNGGSLKNWGHEFSASWTQKLNKDISVTLGGNITFMKNKVISLAEDLPGGIIIDARANNGSAEARTLVGYPIGSFYGYVIDGLYQTDLDRLVSPFAGSVGTYLNGDFKYKDVNGDGIISAADRTVIGNPSPDFIYGGSVGLKYKRLNLDVDFGGVYGNEVFRVWGALESPFQRVNYPALKTERWHGAGTSNWEPIISQARRFNYNGSTYNIEDGSYFRIRNLQLGYDLMSSVLSKVRVKNLRVFVNIQNLKTWKNNNGYTSEFGGRATASGFDEAGGAIPRVTTFGLNVNF
ncbi:MAG: TonB-dependent receptor [Ferruginibacter sp.]